MKTMKIKYNDGTPDATAASVDEALEQIARRYDVPVSELETEDSDGARGSTLVWLDKESARNDDGANAVAEITEQ